MAQRPTPTPDQVEQLSKGRLFHDLHSDKAKCIRSRPIDASDPDALPPWYCHPCDVRLLHKHLSLPELNLVKLIENRIQTKCDYLADLLRAPAGAVDWSNVPRTVPQLARMEVTEQSLRPFNTRALRTANPFWGWLGPIVEGLLGRVKLRRATEESRITSKHRDLN